jgi:hypothetical protein
MAKSCCGGTSSTKPRIATFTGNIRTLAPGEVPTRNGGCCGKGSKSETKPSCACTSAKAQERWILGSVDTLAGKVPRVSTQLEFRDVWGSWKCRWSIGRMNYKIDPGLYCVGSPDAASPVLVTANYKMTFDRLRMELDGVNAWIMVLDTDGVNVWCAAGKGTFGTEELVHRIGAVQLDKIVSHRVVIVPQLGATGVAAHEVMKQAGFKVVFGPVRACDLKAFLSAGMVATEDMRTVKFPIFDRLVLTPMEVVAALKPMVIVFGILFTLNVIGLGHYGRVDFVALLGAIVAGSVVTPVLLPWIPGRAFSVKGGLIGLIWAITVNVWQGFPHTPDYGWLKAVAYFLVIPALSAFYAMNFTGSSTYTSLSGVDKEMKIALPAMLLSTGVGVVMFLVNDFIRAFG